MSNRIKKLIAVLLLIAAFPVFAAGAAPADAAAANADSAAVSAGAATDLFDGILQKIADIIDKVLFWFASNSGKTDAAVVVTDTLCYTASGFESRDGDSFRIGDGFTAKLYGINSAFNRMTFTYSSSQPLELSVTYRSGAKKLTTAYYLDAAEEGSFRCLIEPYIKEGMARKLISVGARTCTGEEAVFALKDIRTEKIASLADQTCYLENGRFRVGVKLGWGGGINYFEDKNCPVEGLTNLINQHDTGRLIQQSYYGTPGNDEYQPGISFDTPWVFNPVQGGDQYGNASRLIDFEITEDSVYVKAQPQDWSLDNALTPCYMENTYTLYGDCVRVDNRFTDYSGWEHRLSHQELPAFYTVSYLSRFSWYDGTNSWQNDALTYRDDLQFWGTYADECTFYFKPGNTETWCSWTSPESGFGAGLYVPNVDILKAGKYEFNNSMDAENDATNYVAPLRVIKITSYQPIEYSYLMTTGSVDEIRQTFLLNRDFADNAGLNENSVSSRTGG